VDSYKGFHREFPVAVPFWVMLISSVFLIAKAMS
jgi:hypothetical protein